MKYLWNHPATESFISQWVGDSPVIMANFYFWRIGTSNQKSLEGLIRAIVCQILRFDPILTKELFPGLWDRAYGHEEDEMPLDLPRLNEMKALALRITQCNRLKDTKLCFFIDGIDEYSGDFRDGIDFIQSLSTRSNTKLIISSRPEPAFVESFRNLPTLRLEDLTRDDIRKYVKDKLGEHSYIHNLIAMGSISESEELISEIVQKAMGVFLWVVLACRSLLDGFAAYDRMSELRQRIDELPPQLEDLFRLMLERVDRRYRFESAKLLRLCYENSASSGSIPLPTIGLALLDEFNLDPAMMPRMQDLTMSQMADKCTTLEGRLRSRCGGLLEINLELSITPADSDPSSQVCFCGQINRQRHNRVVDSTVGFMHRTVFEFLDTDGVWDIDCLDFGGWHFSPGAALACIFLHATGLSQLLDKNGQMLYYIDYFLRYFLTLRPTTFDSAFPIILRFEEFISSLEANQLDTFHICTQCSPQQFVLRIYVESGLVPLVQRYLTSRSLLLKTPHGSLPLLYHATNRYILDKFLGWGSTKEVSTLQEAENSSASPLMVEFLLSLGCDPLEKFAVNGAVLSGRASPTRESNIVADYTVTKTLGWSTPFEEVKMKYMDRGIDDLENIQIMEKYIVNGQVEVDDTFLDLIANWRHIEGGSGTLWPTFCLQDVQRIELAVDSILQSRGRSRRYHNQGPSRGDFYHLKRRALDDDEINQSHKRPRIWPMGALRPRAYYEGYSSSVSQASPSVYRSSADFDEDKASDRGPGPGSQETVYRGRRWQEKRGRGARGVV